MEREWYCSREQVSLGLRHGTSTQERKYCPLPDINKNLNQLSRSKVFSVLDSCGAVHTVPLSKDSKHYTAFVSPLGHYEFNYLPFGLRNAAGSYSRLVDKALAHLPSNFALSYVGKIIVHSVDIPEHVGHLRAVLEAHVRYGMKLELHKCLVARPKIDYLGHHISVAWVHQGRIGPPKEEPPTGGS